MADIYASCIAYSNIEWASSPDVIEVGFSSKQLNNYKNILDKQDANSPDIWTWCWASSYFMYSECEEDEEGALILDGMSGWHKEFEPEYRIGVSEIRLYKKGNISIVLLLKHSSEEIWGEFNLYTLLDLLRKTEENSPGSKQLSLSLTV